MMRESTIRGYLEQINFMAREKKDIVGALKIYCTCKALKAKKIVRGREDFFAKFQFRLCGYMNKTALFEQANAAYARIKRELLKKDFYMEYNDVDKYIPEEPVLPLEKAEPVAKDITIKDIDARLEALTGLVKDMYETMMQTNAARRERELTQISYLESLLNVMTKAWG